MNLHDEIDLIAKKNGITEHINPTYGKKTRHILNQKKFILTFLLSEDKFYSIDFQHKVLTSIIRSREDENFSLSLRYYTEILERYFLKEYNVWRRNNNKCELDPDELYWRKY